MRLHRTQFARVIGVVMCEVAVWGVAVLLAVGEVMAGCWHNRKRRPEGGLATAKTRSA